MNLADPELELIDPTPNVYNLFIHFDKLFFWTKLTSRAVVRWSKKMYSCAGICSYEGRGGLCDIALSEPLLKLRPRKDLIETLLHEMIHAYLFITCQDRERDGHGPNFQAHMHRINRSAGLNISIYHDFHDEVKLYQTHWWRCNGPCQKLRPYFGIVRRSQNRAPGPNDYWWSSHQRNCGGTFVKIKEPEKTNTKKGTKEKVAKNKGDMKKYVTKKINNDNVPDEIRKPLTPLVKNVTGTPATKMKSNGANTLVITQKGNKNLKGSPTKVFTPITAFTGKGEAVSSWRNRSNSVNVTETVRSIWANKQLPGFKPITPKIKPALNYNSTDERSKPNKQKADPIHSDSPPAKVKKIDDYFKSTATSLLKDLYGEDIILTQADNKIVAVTHENLVHCPVCNQEIADNEINSHLDECLNKEVIEKLSKDNIIVPITQESISKPLTPKFPDQSVDRKSLKDIVGVLPAIPAYKKRANSPSSSEKMFKEDNGEIKPVSDNAFIDLTNINNLVNIPNIKNKPTVKIESAKESETNHFSSNDVNRVKTVVKSMNNNKHNNIRKSDNFVMPKEEVNDVDCGFVPSFLDDMGIKATVKTEPSTSKDITSTLIEQKCPCCGDVVNKPTAEHLDECLAFFGSNTTVPEEGASTSFDNNTIVIDDEEDDIFDETLTLNATGTKTPCPCCMEMIEMAEMNGHLDNCLS